MKINAAAYIRVSTDDQTEYSPDAQLREIRRFAENNDMLLLSEYIYIDAGISGRTAAKRPSFMRMISAAKNKEKPFNVILVHKFDRFSRNKEESVAYKAALKKDGIRVISVTEHIEDDKFGVIMESMLEAMAEYYSLNLSEEVKKGQKEKALRGEVQTKPCFGYKMEHGKMLIVPDEAQYVEYMYNSFLNDIPIKQICNRLNALNVLTKAGKQFTDDAVRYILRNPTYKGYSHWNAEGRTTDTKRLRLTDTNAIVVKGNWQPIIPEDLWENVHSKLLFQYRIHQRKARPASEYAGCLSALVKCGTCGSSLVYVGKRKYLQCNNYGHAKCTVSHLISAKRVEDAILDELNHITSISSPETYRINIKKLEKTPQDSMEQMLTEKQIASLEKKKDRLKTAYLNEVITIEEYKNDKTQLEEEIDKLHSQIKKAPQTKMDFSSFKNKVCQVREIFTSDNEPAEKSKALKSIIEKITFDKSSQKLIFSFFYQD